MIKLKCSNCNKDFSIYPYRLKKCNKICCSVKCTSEYKMKFFGTDKIINYQDFNLNPNFYYLLGLICTDGHIRIAKNYRQVGINLQIGDKDVLNDIQKIFGGSFHEYPNRKHPVASWNTYYKEFTEYLINTINIKPNNKTFDLDVNKWFKTLSENNKKYFIRGVFDGDGGITYNQKKTGFLEWSVSFVSCSQPFFNMVENFLLNLNLIDTKYILDRKHLCYYLCWGKRQLSYNLLKFLYNNLDINNDLFIRRKYNAFSKIKEDVDRRLNYKGKWRSKVIILN